MYKIASAMYLEIFEVLQLVVAFVTHLVLHRINGGWWNHS